MTQDKQNTTKFGRQFMIAMVLYSVPISILVTLDAISRKLHRETQREASSDYA